MQSVTPPVKARPFTDLFGDITAEDVAQILRPAHNVNHQMLTDGTTPLHHAKSASVAEALIAHGANVNAKDYKGLTPIYHMRSASIAQVLVAHGANVNAPNFNGITPLHHIENPSYAEALITLGADVNARDRYGLTPLHHCKNASLAEALIAHGADVNAADREGRTPLHRACEIQDGETFVKVLVAHGADVHARCVRGETPLHQAASSHCVKDGMLDKKVGNLSIVHALMSAGADINARSWKGADHSGCTPLDRASEPDIYEAMVFAGAEVTRPPHYLSPECVEARDRGQARRQAVLRTQRAGSLDNLYAALDAPAEPVSPRPPRVRQRC